MADIDSVYVLQANGQLFIKCVRRRVDGVRHHQLQRPAGLTRGWAGHLYGDGAIPLRWEEQLQGKHLVEPMLERLTAQWG